MKFSANFRFIFWMVVRYVEGEYMSVIQDIFAEFEKKRDELEITIDDFMRDIARFKNHILLYGAGSSGLAFLYFLRQVGVEPIYFIDSDGRKIGKNMEGVPIISPNGVMKKNLGEFLVIVCINTDGKRYCKSFADALRIGGHHGVYQKLYDAGCKNVVDYTFFRRCFTLFKNERYNAPSCSDVDLMVEHQGDINSVYEQLDDDLSKDVFAQIVKFRLLDDSISIPTMEQDQQYFEAEFYVSDKNAVFVDCGAYNGISAKTFFRVNGEKFDGYYGIEPDHNNFTELEKYANSLPDNIKHKFHIYEKALWEDETKINLYELAGPGSFVANDIGVKSVPTVTVDKLVSHECVTFIKMNIEGSEKEALYGAKNTIVNYRPRLAIAGYHRTDDLWKIPLIIKEYCPDYSLHLRSYMNHISFVYYAM